MKKTSLLFAGTLGIVFMLGSTPGYAVSVSTNKTNVTAVKSLEPLYALQTPMGLNNVNLVVDIKKPVGEGYFLEDHGKYLQLPHSGDTVITHVTPFLYLTAFGYPHDFLVMERDKKDKSIIYLNVYNYFNGKLTKVTSIKTDPAIHPESEIHVAHENGFFVYFNEHRNGEFVSSTAYQWDYKSKTYKKAGFLSKPN